jgi:hypothetical protein
VNVVLTAGTTITVELTPVWQPVLPVVYKVTTDGKRHPLQVDCTSKGRDYHGAPVVRLRGPFLEVARIDPNDGLIRALEMMSYPLWSMELRLGSLAVSSLLQAGGLAGPWERRRELFVRPWIVPPPEVELPNAQVDGYWWSGYGATESVAAVVCREQEHDQAEGHDNEAWTWATEMDSNNGQPSAEHAQVVADRQLLSRGHLFVDALNDLTLNERPGASYVP